MASNAITSRERVMMAIDHVQPPDRPPVTIYTTPEIDSALQDYFGVEDYRDILEIDLRYIEPPFDMQMREAEPGSGVDFYDKFGVGYKKVANPSGGVYDEACDLTLARLETMDDVAKHPWPSPDDNDYSQLPAQIDRCKGYAVCFGGAGTPDIINGVSRGRGMEQVLIDIITEDEVGIAIIDKRVDYYYEHCRRALEAGNGKIDILCLGEDLGTQKGTVTSPAVFDNFFRPRLKKFYDLAHHFGAKAMMHSCGSTRAVQPKLMEMGLDVLDAVQPEPVGMDPVELKSIYGDRLTYCGMISTQHTLPHGTEQECRAEARHRIDVIGQGGGYIFAPAHCIQPDTPLVNVLAIYEEVLGKKLM